MSEAAHAISGANAPALSIGASSPSGAIGFRLCEASPKRREPGEGETGSWFSAYRSVRLDDIGAIHAPSTATGITQEPEAREKDFRRLRFGGLVRVSEYDLGSSLPYFATRLFDHTEPNRSVRHTRGSLHTFPNEIERYVVVGDNQREWTAVGDWLEVAYFVTKEEANPIASLAELVRPTIRELVKLERGWDGYAALPVCPDVAEHACRLLSIIGKYTQIVPSVVPLSDGGLQLEWFVGEDEIEVLIDSECATSVFHESEREVEETQFAIENLRDDTRIAQLFRELR